MQRYKTEHSKSTLPFTLRANYPAPCNVITVIGVVIWHEKESYIYI